MTATGSDLETLLALKDPTAHDVKVRIMGDVAIIRKEERA